MGIKQIRTTHAGALPRSAGLTKMIRDRSAGGAVDEAFLEHMLSREVAEAVRLQRDCGLDSINDGELSKSNFMHYITERVSGIFGRRLPRRSGETRSTHAGLSLNQASVQGCRLTGWNSVKVKVASPS